MEENQERKTNTNLPDILVSHPADLLDVGSALGDTLEGVTAENELVLLGSGDGNLNTGLHDDLANDLLANEVSGKPRVSTISLFPTNNQLPCPPHLPFSLGGGSFAVRVLDVPDLNLEKVGLLVLLNVDVDGEMRVDVAHLVLEALGDTDDQVVDEGSDCSESSDVLAVSVVDLDADDTGLGHGEGDRQVAEVLDELAYFITSSVRISISPLGSLSGSLCSPRGPSTVTILDLIETLTVAPARQHSPSLTAVSAFPIATPGTVCCSETRREGPR